MTKIKLKPKRPEMDLSKAAVGEIKKALGEVVKKSDDACWREVQQFHKLACDQLENHNQLFKEMADRFASWEETLLLVYHNIKKNQFLYAHYPDDWVKKYSDIKQGLRDENEAMDERKLTA